MPIITAKVPVSVVASVLACLESGDRRNWNNRNEVTVDTYHNNVGTGYLQKGLLIIEQTN